MKVRFEGILVGTFFDDNPGNRSVRFDMQRTNC